MKDEACNKAEWCIEKFNLWMDSQDHLLHNKHFPLYVNITFDLKGHCAGQAFLNNNNNKIRLNMYLLEKYGTRFIEDTVPHEMAHLFVRHLEIGEKSHGYMWRFVMWYILKVEPNVRHKYKTVPARTVKLYTYACACMDHVITANIHGKICKGTVYKCKHCKQQIVHQPET